MVRGGRRKFRQVSDVIRFFVEIGEMKEKKGIYTVGLVGSSYGLGWI